MNNIDARDRLLCQKQQINAAAQLDSSVSLYFPSTLHLNCSCFFFLQSTIKIGLYRETTHLSWDSRSIALQDGKIHQLFYLTSFSPPSFNLVNGRFFSFSTTMANFVYLCKNTNKFSCSAESIGLAFLTEKDEAKNEFNFHESTH